MQGPSNGYQHPLWFQKILSDSIENFRQEWQITHDQVIKYVWGHETKERCKRLVEILSTVDIKAEPYYCDDLPSWGVLLDELDPVLVEYVLKYSNIQDKD